jgi:hypothetical protein
MQDFGQWAKSRSHIKGLPIVRLRKTPKRSGKGREPGFEKSTDRRTGRINHLKLRTIDKRSYSFRTRRSSGGRDRSDVMVNVTIAFCESPIYRDRLDENDKRMNFPNGKRPDRIDMESSIIRQSTDNFTFPVSRDVIEPEVRSSSYTPSRFIPFDCRFSRFASAMCGMFRGRVSNALLLHVRSTCNDPWWAYYYYDDGTGGFAKD